MDKIISSAKEMIGYEKTYEVIFDNSEKFATNLRYDWCCCELVRPPLGGSCSFLEFFVRLQMGLWETASRACTVFLILILQHEFS